MRKHLSAFRLVLVVAVLQSTCAHAATGRDDDDSGFDGSVMHVPSIRVVSQPTLCKGPAIPVGRGMRYYACVEDNLKRLAPADPDKGDFPVLDGEPPIT